MWKHQEFTNCRLGTGLLPGGKLSRENKRQRTAEVTDHVVHLDWAIARAGAPLHLAVLQFEVTVIYTLLWLRSHLTLHAAHTLPRENVA